MPDRGLITVSEPDRGTVATSGGERAVFCQKRQIEFG